MTTEKIPIRSNIPAKYAVIFNILVTGAALAWFTPSSFAQWRTPGSQREAVCQGSSGGGCGSGSSSSGAGALGAAIGQALGHAIGEALFGNPEEGATRQAEDDAELQQQAEIQHQNRIAANNMQQAIQNFAQTLNAAPSSGGLDFDGGNTGAPPSGGNSGGLEFTSAVSTPNQTRPATALQFGD